jgi:polysaccharide deacetylase 2 family uncharacterized protein YibQ
MEDVIQQLLDEGYSREEIKQAIKRMIQEARKNAKIITIEELFSED